jgi:hypothetical protein
MISHGPWNLYTLFLEPSSWVCSNVVISLGENFQRVGFRTLVPIRDIRVQTLKVRSYRLKIGKARNVMFLFWKASQPNMFCPNLKKLAIGS